jgi:hypothetical protein
MPLIKHLIRPPLDETIVSLRFLRALDRASRGRKEWPDEGVEELFRILKKPGQLGNVCARFGLFENEAEERHVRQDWFGEGGKGWWPTEPMEALFRKGMIRAIELMREYDLPLASYWYVRKGSRHVQINFAVSSHQVTLLISTPPPRRSEPHAKAVANPRVWAVGHVRSRVISVPGRMPVEGNELHIPPDPCLIKTPG